MKNLGYIKLWRKIKDSPLYKKKRKFSKLEAWIDLLLMANHQEGKILVDLKVVKISRGQVFTSQLGLSKEWGWSIGSVNNFLKFLKAENQIDYKGESKYTIISILNWDKYQGISEKNETKKEGEIENRMKPKRKQNETYKNDKNDKNEKKESLRSEKGFSFKKKKEKLINEFLEFEKEHPPISNFPEKNKRKFLADCIRFLGLREMEKIIEEVETSIRPTSGYNLFVKLLPEEMRIKGSKAKSVGEI